MVSICLKLFMTAFELSFGRYFIEVCSENISFAKTYDHDFLAKVLKVS